MTVKKHTIQLRQAKLLLFAQTIRLQFIRNYLKEISVWYFQFGTGLLIVISENCFTKHIRIKNKWF